MRFVLSAALCLLAPAAPAQVDLVITGVTVPPNQVAGTSMVVSVTVLNQGTTASGPFDLDFFVGSAVPVSPLSPHLHTVPNIPGLGPNTATVLPAVVVPTMYQLNRFSPVWIGAWVDVQNNVPESNDANNGFIVPGLITFRPAPRGPNVARLEFDSEPSYPKFHTLGLTATMFRSTGTGKGMVLTAPDQAGEFYMIGASLTGTSPGIPLGGGLTLPLFPDSFFYAIANVALLPGPPLYGFAGILDANGQSSGSFLILPGEMPLGTYYFAAATFVSGPGGTVFTNATNYVTLTVIP
jgi:hypothetical protein